MEKTAIVGLEWTAYYIGLPDMQYRDVKVIATSKQEARDMADAELLRIYGKDGFDCIDVRLDDSLCN